MRDSKWVVFAGVAVALVGCQKGTSNRGKIDSTTDYVIYGDDNRREWYQAENEQIKTLARSTGALMSSSDLVKSSGGRIELPTGTFGEFYGLCSEEPYREQRAAAFCSGFLVGPQTFVTAGHCIADQAACESTSIVFDYALLQAQEVVDTVDESKVYKCKEILGRQELHDGADFAVIRLNRPVEDRAPLAIRRSGTIDPGASLTVVGHPSGLPLKIADGANVRRVEQGFFVANLDTYGGNSGSAVFNSSTLEVEGVLVRGEQDFVYEEKKQCTVSHRCANDGCQGEDVTKIEFILPYLPPDGGEPMTSGASTCQELSHG